jgi:hypothetical protein
MMVEIQGRICTFYIYSSTGIHTVVKLATSLRGVLTGLNIVPALKFTLLLKCRV